MALSGEPSILPLELTLPVPPKDKKRRRERSRCIQSLAIGCDQIPPSRERAKDPKYYGLIAQDVEPLSSRSCLTTNWMEATKQ